ncbi:anthranilate phosphoribosyltransferase [Pelagibacterium flavum]|uniref:Anthranilate phosphoribosyltransferase n=1 Tax=Pelagibacterium flavum TaxID=2984530 RepID=A0ABY6ITX6_9HYPH|nr:anthranilate phosphoribosyltransferase [Pelagibacterium sp. YIM 151497]UYQ74101.1 anthranilate phosphoribosyltransferase [Pelagibacterium sp. YIM 151497]
MMDIKGALNRIADGKDLTGTEMRQVMDIIMSGEATASQIGAFLMGMRVKGETVGEIAAAVSIMRNKMVPVEAPADAIDIVGTGGDGAGTLNISTGASIVVAAAGVPVAKHGNRALSSKSGSAEALQKLSISLELTPEQISACIREAGIGFMFAPNHHPAMRHVGPTRAEMGVRTMFNLLGPQSNPAGVKRYLLGVFDNEWVEPVAAALLANQAQAAWVVHGDSGLDELSTTGPSFVSQIKNGNLTSFEVTPEDAGLPRAKLEDIVGGDPEHNAGELRKLLEGAKGAYRDIVLLNAAAAFIIADKVQTLPEGVAMGAEAIDSGKARATLDKLVAVSGAQ